MTVHDVVQRSPAWYALRVGRLGASQAAAMLATGRSGEAISRASLRQQLAAEQVTGRSYGSRFESAAMRDGIDREPAAVAAYEAQTGLLVRRVGYVSHDTVQAGGSPDGVVGAFAGLVEIKAPLDTTHQRYLAGTLPGAHHAQIVHALWLTGAAWCDWVSYHPAFPPASQLRIVRVTRDEREVAAYAWAVATFLREVEQTVAALARTAVA